MRVYSASIDFHRDLDWLAVNLGSLELNFYWLKFPMPRRWRRFELKRHGLVAGPLTLLARKRLAPQPYPEGRPHLTGIDGGRAHERPRQHQGARV